MGQEVAGLTGAEAGGLEEVDGVRSVAVTGQSETEVRILPDQAELAISTVEKAGYGAIVHDDEDDTWTQRAAEERSTSLRRRLAVASLITVPLCDITILLALVPWLSGLMTPLAVALRSVPIVTRAALAPESSGRSAYPVVPSSSRGPPKQRTWTSMSPSPTIVPSEAKDTSPEMCRSSPARTP